MGIRNYRDLTVWQKGMDLVRDVYRLTSSMPKCEQFGLSDQMQRSAVSIPTNIAEGHARDSTKEFVRHLAIARGSLAELETLLSLASTLGYATPKSIGPLLDQCAEESRMLRALQSKLKERKKP